VCLGASITTMGWPQLTAGLLRAGARIAVLNRGIPGNRLRLDAPPRHASWGRSGLSRFDEDVLGTAGVTHVVLIDRARAAGLGVILATITPMAPEQGDDPGREQIRVAVNDWIRTSGLEVADFDETIRSDAAPSRIAAQYDVGDHQHPNVTGENRLARAMAEAIARLPL
jgi:hypothetical protein